MAKKQAQIPTNLQPWIEARRKFHLSHAHVQMARELGMNPKKLGKLDNHGQEPWKLPLREFIVAGEACVRRYPFIRLRSVGCPKHWFLVLGVSFPAYRCPMEMGQRRVGWQRRWRRKRIVGLGLRRAWGPGPDAPAGSNPLEPKLNCIRLRSVGWRQDRKTKRVRQEAKRFVHWQRAYVKTVSAPRAER